MEVTRFTEGVAVEDRLEPVLEAVELYRFYHAGDDETSALRGVSVVVHRGEMVAVTGPSGSGKSTLLACLAGIDEPDAGSVRVAGERMSRHSESERAALRARKIGMLFQTGNLLDHLSVEQNIAVAQRMAGHESSRTTGLYDRRNDQVSLDEVERISI